MQNMITLNRNKDFNRLYSRGRSYVEQCVVVYVLKNRLKQVRIGITTSKKIGNAVKRNRARRLIRESCRKLLPNVRPGVDLVFVARKKTTLVKCDEVLKAILKALKEANIWMDSLDQNV